MNTLSNLGSADLLRAAKLKDRITKLTKELDAIFGGSSSAPKKKRNMSAAGRAAIRAAQKARWAKIKAAKKA
jgi:hypothetical protein